MGQEAFDSKVGETEVPCSMAGHSRHRNGNTVTCNLDQALLAWGSPEVSTLEFVQIDHQQERDREVAEYSARGADPFRDHWGGGCAWTRNENELLPVGLPCWGCIRHIGLGNLHMDADPSVGLALASGHAAGELAAHSAALGCGQLDGENLDRVRHMVGSVVEKKACSNDCRAGSGAVVDSWGWASMAFAAGMGRHTLYHGHLVVGNHLYPHLAPCRGYSCRCAETAMIRGADVVLQAREGFEPCFQVSSMF